MGGEKEKGRRGADMPGVAKMATPWPEVCWEEGHRSLKLLWCIDCRSPACLKCATVGDCAAHLTSNPDEVQGMATRVALPVQMTRYWAQRRPFLEKALDQLNTGLRVRWSEGGEDIYLEGVRGQVKAATKFLAEFQESARKVTMAPGLARYWGERKAYMEKSMARMDLELIVSWEEGEEGEEMALEGQERQVERAVRFLEENQELQGRRANLPASVFRRQEAKLERKTSKRERRARGRSLEAAARARAGPAPPATPSPPSGRAPGRKGSQEDKKRKTETFPYGSTDIREKEEKEKQDGDRRAERDWAVLAEEEEGVEGGTLQGTEENGDLAQTSETTEQGSGENGGGDQGQMALALASVLAAMLRVPGLD